MLCWVNVGFPCGSAGKESACNAGDLGSIPGQGAMIPCATGQLSPHLLKQKISHDSIEILIAETMTQGYMQVRKQQLELDMEQQAGSK